ncbi:MAG: hypothetical protein EB084_11560, partial [Proteobacteria bacterium]|nr:hypothetical protein [Pseudomonadota bacterium]
MLQPGTELQRGYIIESVLGRGGMGAVYLARQSSLGGRKVAIKETVLPGAAAHDIAAATALFRKEAEILAGLEHPGLVDVKDYFEEGGSQFLVMQFIDGASLEEACTDRSRLPAVSDVLDWMIAVADVLTYLHEHQPPVIVRDLKPSNIMLDSRGVIRLIDFGIARVIDNRSETMTFLKGAGTVGYAPLEQMGEGSTDPRSDIYALGATMYRLITGTLPPSAVSIAAGEAATTPPSVLNPDVSPALESLLASMMALRKNDRLASAREALTALRRVRSGAGPSAQTAPPVMTPRFCHQCGATLESGKGFCAKCGERVDTSLGSGGFPVVPPQQPPPPPSGSGGFQT